ncbi:hypothetical protein PG996_015440 [Apiospora saccharicola]|uniref:Uncharacterized protein n=1 Tax=Apiospora saccharicola TaxID=335842 RepID=A0ABR1TNB6_9PEZI
MGEWNAQPPADFKDATACFERKLGHDVHSKRLLFKYVKENGKPQLRVVPPSSFEDPMEVDEDKEPAPVIEMFKDITMTDADYDNEQSGENTNFCFPSSKR